MINVDLTRDELQAVIAHLTRDLTQKQRYHAGVDELKQALARIDELEAML